MLIRPNKGARLLLDTAGGLILSLNRLPPLDTLPHLDVSIDFLICTKDIMIIAFLLQMMGRLESWEVAHLC